MPQIIHKLAQNHAPFGTNWHKIMPQIGLDFMGHLPLSPVPATFYEAPKYFCF
jgi:hypothetical protein